MRILFVSAEVAPFVSVGGLSQVMYFLPKALKEIGDDVRIFTAHYGTMDSGKRVKTWKFRTEVPRLNVPVEHEGDLKHVVQCKVTSILGKKKDPTTYFLENEEYYALRANVFGYKDDHIRFSLLSKGCLEWLLIQEKNLKNGEKESWFPEIIHCNDWHTGYFIELARRNERYKKMLANVPILYAVHNFAYQGNYDFRHGPEKDMDDGSAPLSGLLSEKMQSQNALKRGMIFADSVNTVSKTHAIEVLTPEYSEGLGDTLASIRSKLIGILNGLDTREFNPSRDTIIYKNYSVRSFVDERRVNKLVLQQDFFLPPDGKRPLIAVLARLTQQKGWDLVLDALPHLLSERPEVQVVVVGTGDEQYHHKLEEIQKQFPKQIGLHLRADFRLPRKLFAGSDMMLIPSMFEPGGIVALEALRYGAVPIVRRTGGLNDIVSDFDPATGMGNGFSFANKDGWALFGAITQALTIYKNPYMWHRLQLNCLKCDFSWKHSAKEYKNWYSRTLEEKRRATSSTPHPAYELNTFDKPVFTAN